MAIVVAAAVDRESERVGIGIVVMPSEEEAFRKRASACAEVSGTARDAVDRSRCP